MKTELIHRSTWPTRKAATSAIFDYLEAGRIPAERPRSDLPWVLGKHGGRAAHRCRAQRAEPTTCRKSPDVVLNQMLVGFGDLALTDPIEEVRCDGTCWLGATTWQGRRLVRISVSNWSTTEANLDV